MPIDVVDRIETLAQFADESLDFVIASHVIEHTPNPVAALVAAHRVLRPGGKLILIVPDKRGTFDRKREVTDVAHMVLDYEDYRRERDLAHYEEWYLRVARDKQNKAREDWKNCADIHYHCFTPASFLEFIAAATKYAAWSTSTFLVPQTRKGESSLEFYAVLSK
jgi:SAM-dependent methyltransferase